MSLPLSSFGRWWESADDDEEVDAAARKEATEEILSVVRAAATPSGWDQKQWAEFTAALSPLVVEARREVPRLRVRKPAPELLNGDFDETSLGADAVELDRHGQAVAARARAVARRIGLPPALADMVERAGRLHDIGKGDRRFQRWLDPEAARDVLVAKSHAPRHLWEAMRAAAGWPRGGRHEDLSARLVRAWLQQNPDWGDPHAAGLAAPLGDQPPREGSAAGVAGHRRHARRGVRGWWPAHPSRRLLTSASLIGSSRPASDASATASDRGGWPCSKQS